MAPRLGARRLQARLAIQSAQKHLMHYDAATVGRRSSSLRAASGDADASARRRDRIAYVSRDMLRNNPWAVSARRAVTSNVVGTGIVPKISGPDEAWKLLRDEATRIVEDHLQTTAIDVERRQNLYGLQSLGCSATVGDGEVLIVPRFVERQGRVLPLELRMLEADFLDRTKQGWVQGGTGNVIYDGIEYNADGERVAYWLYEEHPGTIAPKSGRWSLTSQRVDAKWVIHLYRQDRPGQQRGVSWFAPVVLPMQDLADYQDAQILRQKIASCFTAFRKNSETLPEDADPVKKLAPGVIYDLGPDEEMFFAQPPESSGLDEFTRTVLRSIAVGMGITYESLTGDMSQVNYSSARMGRLNMDANVFEWQRLMMIPAMLQPLAEWIKLAWKLQNPQRSNEIDALRIRWTPPHRPIVDPAREIPAIVKKIRAGLQSRQGAQRELGFDPDVLVEEFVEDQKVADAGGLVFDTDARKVSTSGITQARPAGSEIPEEETQDE